MVTVRGKAVHNKVIAALHRVHFTVDDVLRFSVRNVSEFEKIMPVRRHVGMVIFGNWKFIGQFKILRDFADIHIRSLPKKNFYRGVFIICKSRLVVLINNVARFFRFVNGFWKIYSRFYIKTVINRLNQTMVLEKKIIFIFLKRDYNKKRKKYVGAKEICCTRKTRKNKFQKRNILKLKIKKVSDYSKVAVF